MTASDDRPFVRKAFFDDPSLLGARWWNEGAFAPTAFRTFAGAAPAFGAGATVTRRGAVGGLIAMAGLLGVGGAIIAALTRSGSSKFSDEPLDGSWTTLPPDSVDVGAAKDVLAVQREHGWAAGAKEPRLVFEGAVENDAEGAAFRPDAAAGLAAALEPSDPALKPFYSPTLFQVLDGPGGASLRAILKPVRTAATARAFETGRALRSLFLPDDAPESAGRDVALVVDLEGPESVALAAGLGAAFQPVFVFSNWPHPAGVVPAHQTLAAAIYYRPQLIGRPAAAPPAFILDRARLREYKGEPGRFDNRYLAQLPSPESLRRLGVARVMMVTPDANTLIEMDDLNDDVVGWKEAGIGCAIIPATDFAPPSDATALVGVEEPLPGEVPPASERDPAAAPATARVGETRPAPESRAVARHYYGGSFLTHYFFWRMYGGRSFPGVMSAVQPTNVSRAASYVPRPRSTLFSTGLPGGTVAPLRPKPAGFGKVNYRPPSSNRSSGSSSSGSSSSGRSSGKGGSFTRAPSGFGG